MSGPANAKKAGAGGRFYVWGTERYWSVTTILRAFPKDALKWWAARTVAEFAYDDAKTWLGMPRGRAVEYLRNEPLRYTGERADFGSTVHAVAEALALGRPLPDSFETDAHRRAAAMFLHWRDHFNVGFEATEFSCYSRRQRFAGTSDCIVTIPLEVLEVVWPEHPWDSADGKVIRLLGDYKTGGDVVERKGIYPEVSLQLNAYANTDFVGVTGGKELPLGHLDGAFALHLGPAGWRMVPVTLSGELFKAFLFVREVFRFQEVLSKDALGVAYEHFATTEELGEEAQTV